MADHASLTKRRVSREKKSKGNDKEAKRELEVIDKILPHLDEGKPAITADISDDDYEIMKEFFLLTSKRTIFACNVSEDDLGDTINSPEDNSMVARVQKYAEETHGAEINIISARIEEELIAVSPEEAKEFFSADKLPVLIPSAPKFLYNRGFLFP